MKLRTALLAASVLAAPALAFAQTAPGPYVSLGVGAQFPTNQNVTTDSAAPGGQLTSDADVTGVGALGYDFGGLRLEIQGAYGQDKISGLAGEPASGHSRQYGAFGNALFDFPIPGLISLVPYAGFGLGYEEQGFDSATYGGAGEAVSGKLNSSHGGFGVQGIFGVSYDVPGFPQLSLTAEGRVISLPQTVNYSGPSDEGGSSFKADGPLNYAALIGVRYSLYTVAAPAPAPTAEAPPPAPAVAAPAPAPSRTYLVFFDWDRADLTTRAREIISEAAQASTHVQTTRIEVNGYTDLSGTAAYNQRLSVRRAQSVEAELVRDGVAQNEISIHGYGEANPLVPTAPGVREPQNRRVEIILH